jgi:hypothetical protein
MRILDQIVGPCSKLLNLPSFFLRSQCPLGPFFGFWEAVEIGLALENIVDLVLELLDLIVLTLDDRVFNPVAPSAVQLVGADLVVAPLLRERVVVSPEL